MQNAGRLLASNQFPVAASQQLKNNVLSIMTVDEIGSVARSDDNILLIGSSEIETRGNEKAGEVSQLMRLLARLLIKTRELSGKGDLSIEEMISPGYFDDVVAGARSLGGYTGPETSKSNRFCVPSTSNKCGFALRKAVFALKGKGVHAKNMDMKKDVDLFQELYDGEWSGKVSRQALQSLSTKKHNKPQLLPATKDLQSLRMFLRDGIQTLTKEVRENPMRENWRKLAVLALARLMIFNKRRSMLYLINSL